MAAQSSAEESVVKVIVPFSIDGKKQSIEQQFHINYFEGKTKTIKGGVLAVAQEVHKELFYIAEVLGIEYGKGRDPNLEMLCACREMQKTRLAQLTNVLIAMSNGTFSFTCQKGQCSRYTNCPERRDLTETRMALPEATACKWFREQQEGVSRPYGKRAAFF